MTTAPGVPPAPTPPAAASLVAELTADLDQRLQEADADLVSRFPGDVASRQPVHTVYIPADRYAEDVVPEWGEQARAALVEHHEVLTELLGEVVAQDVLPLVASKLEREPIEDLRIDFEDGYGNRGDEAEDADVQAASAALARSQQAGTAPPFTGIRFKSFEAPTRARGVRTLATFLSSLLEAGGSLEGFVVTFPKVTSVDQIEAMVHACDRIERGLGLPEKAIRYEIQVETPQSILGPDGSSLVARMIHASAGRATALHYGTYDYSAFCGIPAPYQSMEHPVADQAKLVMQAAAAGTGVRLSDGSTNILPLGTPEEVRAGYALHLRLIRRSLERGYYQGWDLHPAQLPSRFAATYAFYRENFPSAALRLSNYLAQATGNVMDEPATARTLADLVVRGLDCGALLAEEVQQATGVEPQALIDLARPRRG